LVPAGPVWPRLVLVGAVLVSRLSRLVPRWPLLAPVGPYWFRFVPVVPIGPRWYRLAPFWSHVGPGWSRLVSIDPTLVPVGPGWFRFAHAGPGRSTLVPIGSG